MKDKSIKYIKFVSFLMFPLFPAHIIRLQILVTYEIGYQYSPVKAMLAPDPVKKIYLDMYSDTAVRSA